MMQQINNAKIDFGRPPARMIPMMVILMTLVVSSLSLAKSMNQLTFASPDEAVSAVVEALNSEDVKALEEIFGPDSQEMINSGDPIADQAGRANFLNLYEEKNMLAQRGDRTVLFIGNEDWPFPIPMVKKDGVWLFDTIEGRDEILARRIGRNELNAIQVCLAYVDAQQEYAREDRKDNGLFQYAQKFRSDRGKKNGLYWDVKAGEKKSPMGLLIASAQEQGYGGKPEDDSPVPYHGYYYKILKGQGKNAVGGAYDYVVKGKMIGGFALIAFPAGYESSGIMTFMVNHLGVVYEKDLGLDTEQEAQSIELFNPDSSWKKVEEYGLEE
jgi:hypothetical protein